MARLHYTGITSLDGYIVDADGSFDWSEPDEEVHAFVNDRERPIGTYLYGRRLYEVMRVWETMSTADEPSCIADYADIWRAAEKIVYSTTLTALSTPRSRLEPRFEVDTVRQLKTEATADLGIGGAELAGVALRAGLVDQISQFVSPVIVGGGRRFLPDDLRMNLTLQEERRFGNGVVYVSYAVRG